MEMPRELPSGYYRRVYVWELPVRFFHWINAAAITILTITGFYIGRPIMLEHGLEAYDQFAMGTVRYLHFASAYIMVVNLLLRIYWGYAGNEYAGWKTFIPVDSFRREEILHVLRVDIFQVDHENRISIGHNALAGLIYAFLFLFMLFQAGTGFALYADMSHSWIPHLFSWVGWFFDGDYEIRQWHHTAMWFFVLFILVHVYLTFYHDYVEGRGVVSSIVGGWKFCRRERLEDPKRK